MSESSDYTPGAWRGHDFGAARKRYDHHVGRSYGDAQAKRTTATSLVPAEVTTDSPTPLIIWVDVTGSMGRWPATIFSKLPYLDHEIKTEYLGADAEVCFGAIGDAHSDKYPVQVQPFTIGTEMTKKLEALVIEGNGGGQLKESYELAALYTLHNIHCPKATIKPVVVMIGDEAAYDSVSVAEAKNHAKVKIASQVSTKAIFESLMEAFDLYLVLKPYRSGNDPTTREVEAFWVNLLGKDHIAWLDDPDRVVDVIFGCLAHATGREDYFRSEIEGRQTKAQVKTVYKALDTIHQIEDDWKDLKPKTKGKSTLHRPPKGKKSKGLL
jgi:hypothetical protein